jgi:hypothetical protein
MPRPYTWTTTYREECSSRRRKGGRTGQRHDKRDQTHPQSHGERVRDCEAGICGACSGAFAGAMSFLQKRKRSVAILIRKTQRLQDGSTRESGFLDISSSNLEFRKSPVQKRKPQIHDLVPFKHAPLER